MAANNIGIDLVCEKCKNVLNVCHPQLPKAGESRSWLRVEVIPCKTCTFNHTALMTALNEALTQHNKNPNE